MTFKIRQTLWTTQIDTAQISYNITIYYYALTILLPFRYPLDARNRRWFD